MRRNFPEDIKREVRALNRTNSEIFFLCWLRSHGFYEREEYLLRRLYHFIQSSENERLKKHFFCIHSRS
jgi:hypothetical protein